MFEWYEKFLFPERSLLFIFLSKSRVFPEHLKAASKKFYVDPRDSYMNFYARANKNFGSKNFRDKFERFSEEMRYIYCKTICSKKPRRGKQDNMLFYCLFYVV